LLATGVAISGCGKSADAGDRVSGKTLTIYASVPLQGPSRASARAVIDGARLALAQAAGHIGKYRIVFRPLDDSTVQRGQWDPGQTTLNARRAVRDPSTIGYLGEFNSGASAVSIPLLNRTGIPQISPTSTAVGLTSASPGASPGEPQKYYPTGIRTFVRVIPSDAIQAAAQVKLQRSMACRNTYVVDDGEFDGEELATSFELAARAARLPVLGVQAFPPKAPDYRPFAASVASNHPDCVLITGIPGTGVVPVTRQLAAAMPDASLFASNGLAQSSYVDPNLGGIPAAVAARIALTAVPLGPGAMPAPARTFDADFTRRFGRGELPAIYGYEAMNLLLGAIAESTDGGRQDPRRSRVLAAIFDSRPRAGVLGPYSILRDGDTTLRRYGVYRIRDGRLSFWKAVEG
jgi:branched-chain amino acid transport system substrate-binding protein